jgi:intracellular sulfur oxidation DsrE/DsrF family protein
MTTVVVINQAQMGSGDEQLGRKILATCLRKLYVLPGLEAIVLFNAGVKLATRDSFVATELTQLHEHGVDILPCGTCVEHFGLKGQMLVDHISNMDEIVAALGKAEKVITL